MTAIGKKNRKNQFARLPAYSYSSKKKPRKINKKNKTNTRNSLYNNLLLFYEVWNIKPFKTLIYWRPHRNRLFNCSYFITTAMQYFIFRFPEPVEIVKNFSKILLDSLTVRVPRCIKISHSMKRKASPNNRKMFENVETNYH